MTMNKRYIILDRDGVINQLSTEYIKTVEELRLIQKSADAIAILTKANFKIFVVSNQSAIGRGLTTAEEVEKINKKINIAAARLSGKIDGFYICPHLPSDNCLCRKPRTGMLKAIEKDFSISLKGSFLVGDSSQDILAAQASAMIPLLVRTGYGKKTELSFTDMNKSNIFDDLFCAVTEGVLK